MNLSTLAFNKSNRIYPKSNFKMCITTIKENPDEIGEKHFKVISSEWIDCKGADFRKSLDEDYKNGIKHEIEIVYEKPKTFVFNKIYVLATRDKVWVWKLNEEN